MYRCAQFLLKATPFERARVILKLAHFPGKSGKLITDVDHNIARNNLRACLMCELHYLISVCEMYNLYLATKLAPG
jgi:hypothetical protein